MPGQVVVLGVRGDTTEAIRIDELTYGLRVVDARKAAGHLGWGFAAAYCGELARNATLDILVRAVGREAQIKGRLATSGGLLESNIHRRVTASDSGSQLVVAPYSDAIERLPTVEVYSGPTISDWGLTDLTSWHFGSIKTSPFERVMARNTDYLIRLTNKARWTTELDLLLYWIEEDGE